MPATYLTRGLMGAADAAAGTRVAAIKPLGSTPTAVSNPDNHAALLVRHGNQWVPLKTAIAMGLVRFDGTTVTELNGPQAAAFTG